MKKNDFDTLAQAVNYLTNEGFTEDFKAKNDHIEALYSKKKFLPNQLKITATCRFDGMTNPADESELFAIESEDGLKGTLVMSYSAEHNQNVDLIQLIKTKE